jgi:hypothetical protein
MDRSRSYSPDDEQFNGGISSGVEQFYVDDGWVFINPSTFILSWVITNPLSLTFNYG